MPCCVHRCIPCLPTRYDRSVQAAFLLLVLFPIEYETVNPRLPLTLPFACGLIVYLTLGTALASFSFWATVRSCAHVFGGFTPAFAIIALFVSIASGDQSFGRP